jgi:hypothetical protein
LLKDTRLTADYAPGARLVINDASAATHRTFYKTELDIAVADVTVDITVEVSAGSVGLQGQDTGIRAILSEGAGGGEVAVALVDRGGGDLRVAFVTGGGFSHGLQLNWTSEQTFRLQRNIDPVRRGVLTVSGQPPEVISDADLPPARRPSPNFEFGCTSDPASAVTLWGPIGLTVFPMTITPAHAVLIPNRFQGVALDGSFQLAPGSDGIDPGAEGAALRLSTPLGAPIYPVGADFMPVDMEPFFGGWRITSAERARTGIEFFAIFRTSDPTRFRYVFLDGRSNLPTANYSQVRIELEIGDDQGSADMHLVAGKKGTWFMV